jgi:hypothetical protein
MTSSNRDNPNLVAYYQDLADILGIFWQFHKERIQSGNIALALQNDYEAGTVVPFDSMHKIERWRRHGNFRTHKITQDFAESVKSTMQASWQQFLAGLGTHSIKAMLDNVPVPEDQRRFFDQYTRDLAVRADEGVKKYSRADLRDDTSLSGVGEAGMHIGSEATVQLCAIFGDEFKPNSALLLSKINQNDVGDGLKEIGLLRRFDQSVGGASPEYTLLDNSSSGLNRERLRELGLGSTLGCPAAMRVSSETEGYLRSKGVTPSTPTMLEDFAVMTSEQFNHSVREMYAGLTHRQKQTFIDPEQNRILSGEARKVATSERRSCPYGKEK